MKTLITIIFFLSELSGFFFAAPIFVRNTLQEIDACEEKIKLKLVRIWGDDNVDDENQFFRIPCDIKIGKNGLVYIVDYGNHRIQVFDRSGNYVKTIGRQGSGPQDLLYPSALAFDNDKNIVVTEDGNLRIQTFDPNGNYLSCFKTIYASVASISVSRKNEIALSNWKNTLNKGSLVLLYDTRGKIIRSIGKFHERTRSPLKRESIFFVMDKNDDIYISYYGTPVYWKYAYTGEPLQIVTFEMLHGMTRLEENKSKNEFNVTGKMITNAASGISVDQKGRIYLVTTTRPPNNNEKYFLVGAKRFPKIIASENTDRFRLLVFTPSGKVIAAKRLSVFCDKIYVNDDTLFIIDSHMGMKIYEYKISFVGNPQDEQRKHR